MFYPQLSRFRIYKKEKLKHNYNINKYYTIT